MKTHITMIVDRTGSMASMAEEASLAINSFFDEQREVTGEASVLLADFDGMAPFRVYYDCDLDAVGTYALEPRGSTPLYDAIGTGIRETALRTQNFDESDKIYVVIQTDGQENCSSQWTADQVKDLIKEKEGEGWNFIFMATGPQAWDASSAFNGTNMMANNYVRTSSTSGSYSVAFNALNTNLIASRTSSGDNTVDFSYDFEEDED